MESILGILHVVFSLLIGAAVVACVCIIITYRNDQRIPHIFSLGSGVSLLLIRALLTTVFGITPNSIPAQAMLLVAILLMVYGLGWMILRSWRKGTDG